MLKKSLKTCISCDDPINHEGFNLLVCEKCLREQENARIGKPGITFQAKDTGEADIADTSIDG